jgi:hypothetical protein
VFLSGNGTPLLYTFFVWISIGLGKYYRKEARFGAMVEEIYNIFTIIVQFLPFRD